MLQIVKARYGAWLAGVERFDAALFGISAPEAELMDPQQRLLLELSYEAMQVNSLQSVSNVHKLYILVLQHMQLHLETPSILLYIKQIKS